MRLAREEDDNAAAVAVDFLDHEDATSLVVARENNYLQDN
jgi:hypothetical protein